jgi:hypothetical protein
MKLAETGILLHFCGRQGRTIVVVQSSSLMVMGCSGSIIWISVIGLLAKMPNCEYSLDCGVKKLINPFVLNGTLVEVPGQNPGRASE